MSVIDMSLTCNSILRGFNNTSPTEDSAIIFLNVGDPYILGQYVETIDEVDYVRILKEHLNMDINIIARSIVNGFTLDDIRNNKLINWGNKLCSYFAGYNINNCASKKIPPFVNMFYAELMPFAIPVKMNNIANDKCWDILNTENDLVNDHLKILVDNIPNGSVVIFSSSVANIKFNKTFNSIMRRSGKRFRYTGYIPVATTHTYNQKLVHWEEDFDFRTAMNMII